ncbi:MAG: hypothetical protein V3W04_11715 [Gammaproteobacteria bacterium]
MKILDQLKNNTVAIISLVIAISSLGYNTWRNENTEENRNVRLAAFEILLSLGELQVITDHSYYANDQNRGNPIEGWGRVLLIRDLCTLVSTSASQQAKKLQKNWSDNWETLANKQASVDSITHSIEDTRIIILKILNALD